MIDLLMIGNGCLRKETAVTLLLWERLLFQFLVEFDESIGFFYSFGIWSQMFSVADDLVQIPIFEGLCDRRIDSGEYNPYTFTMR